MSTRQVDGSDDLNRKIVTDTIYYLSNCSKYNNNNNHLFRQRAWAAHSIQEVNKE